MSEPPLPPAPDGPPAAPAGHTRRFMRWKVALLTVAALAGSGLLVAAAVVYGGLYNVASTVPHLQTTHSLLETAMHRSVRLRARAIEPPLLGSPAQVQRGAACFRDKCVQCHGAPGVAPGDFAMSLQPLPGSLVDAARRWRSRELYWITRHGIKMSGMPAWEYRLPDAELWALVAFLERLPELAPAAYEAQLAAVSSERCTAVDERDAPAGPVTAGDAARGRIALSQFGCTSCHTIPGVTGSQTHVGTPLAGLASREWIAGRLPNNADNLVRWIREPKRIDPASAMSDMGVSAQHARDMAAYLGTLR